MLAMSDVGRGMALQILGTPPVQLQPRNRCFYGRLRNGKRRNIIAVRELGQPFRRSQRTGGNLTQNQDVPTLPGQVGFKSLPSRLEHAGERREHRARPQSHI